MPSGAATWPRPAGPSASRGPATTSGRTGPTSTGWTPSCSKSAVLPEALGHPDPGTAVVAETFQNADVLSPSSWVTPPGPEKSANSACLTGSTDTSQTPIPDCSAPSSDGAGTGVLRLTDTGNQEEGGVLSSLSVPASNGLDATFDSYQWGGTAPTGSAS